MNRTQRAMKRQMRELENGRSSFKSVYLRGSKEFGGNPNSFMLKKLQAELKDYRKETRAITVANKTTKEVVEV